MNPLTGDDSLNIGADDKVTAALFQGIAKMFERAKSRPCEMVVTARVEDSFPTKAAASLRAVVTEHFNFPHHYQMFEAQLDKILACVDRQYEALALGAMAPVISSFLKAEGMSPDADVHRLVGIKFCASPLAFQITVETTVFYPEHGNAVRVNLESQYFLAGTAPAKPS